VSRSDIGRVQHQAVRTAIPGTTRQNVAAAPLGSRGGASFQRSADQVRGAPAQRGDAADDDNEDDKKPVDRDELKDDDDDIDDDNLPSRQDDEDEDTDPKKGKKAEVT
jgi:hypothetical protein